MVAGEDGARDSLARRKRLWPVSTDKRVSPQERDLIWFSLLAEHGPLPSSFLLRYCEDTHRSDKRARERLTDLFNEDDTPHDGPYLSRPLQQFRTLDSRYNQLVYDLTPASRRALAASGLSPPTAQAGPWLHRFMVSCITASIELAARTAGNIRYIPQSEILGRARTDLRYTVQISHPEHDIGVVKDLMPDALFGLEYRGLGPSRFRFFAVEADRATEPATSLNFNRKSFLRSLLQYEQYVGEGGYREHLALTAPLLALYVSSDPLRTKRMVDMVARRYSRGNSYLLFRTWEDFGPAFRPPQPNPALLTGGWERGGLSPFRIDQAAS